MRGASSSYTLRSNIAPFTVEKFENPNLILLVNIYRGRSKYRHFITRVWHNNRE